MSKCIGVLTAGGDSPGLNAAIRALGKSAQSLGMSVVGFRDGFRGLLENRSVRLDNSALSGIISVGGTVLGTSRDKPSAMIVGSQTLDMTEAFVQNSHQHNLDVLVCLGGGGTAKNAYHLAQSGLNVMTLPKTIDNDIAGTDSTIGFDTALGIASEALDRLHSTAHSLHRIIVVEIMGHNAGWLALGAGLAGGADVILLPELPYDIDAVAEAIRQRSRHGKRFSIVAVAEGAMARQEAKRFEAARVRKAKASDKAEKKEAKAVLAELEAARSGNTLRLSSELERLTGLESRVTILGHLQRGGSPSAADRVLATKLGTACAELIARGEYNVMVASRGETAQAVPLGEIVGQRKTVPLDHAWVTSARSLGTCLGD